MAIKISQKVLAKLVEKHDVTELEVAQCFENRTGEVLLDTREGHRTDPPTLWFIAPTRKRRLLKVCYIQRGADLCVKTAYDANDVELYIYRTKASPVPGDF